MRRRRGVGGAASAASSACAKFAASSRARAAPWLPSSLGLQVEDAFKSAVETGVATHAELIGTRLNAQLEERLSLARETVSSLSVLKGEMKSIGKSLAADAEEEKTPTGLRRHSIFEG